MSITMLMMGIRILKKFSRWIVDLYRRLVDYPTTKQQTPKQINTKEMHQYSFEKLNVWQNSRELTKTIYKITKEFPSDERYGLISQMRRAMISVSSNIAEGSSRKTKKDQAHFYTIAYSSLIELLNQIILSLDLIYIDNEQYLELRSSVELISNQMNALRNSLYN